MARRDLTWLIPRGLLRVHPVLGGLGVVVLFGSAALWAVACPSGGVALGIVMVVVGGWGTLAFSNHEGTPRWAGPWLVARTKRRSLRSSAPYYWRWGLISLAVGLLSLLLGLHLTDCGHDDDTASPPATADR